MKEVIGKIPKKIFIGNKEITEMTNLAILKVTNLKISTINLKILRDSVKK